MKITSEIPGTIRYTTDGNEPTESSEAYTDVIEVLGGTTIKAKIYPENEILFTPSDVESVLLPESQDFAIGTTMSDGSVLFYDRGIEYGVYQIKDGELKRTDGAIDDLSPTSTNWRFLLTQTSVLKTSSDTVAKGKFYSLDATPQAKPDLGRGPANTSYMIGLSSGLHYVWDYVNTHVANGWFVGSYEEFEKLVEAVDSGLVLNIGESGQEVIWTSTEIEYRETSAYTYWYPANMIGNGIDKEDREGILLFRRI